MAWSTSVIHILALVAAVGQAAEPPKSIHAALEEFCSINKDSIGMDMTNQTKVKALMDRVKATLADKMDCSMDPYDPVAGYNEHGKTFEECMAKDAKAYLAIAGDAGGYTLDSFDCIEVIADEGKKLGAAWAHQKWALGGEKFENRIAYRFSFNDDMKFNAYHYIVDLLPVYRRFQEKKSSRLYNMGGFSYAQSVAGPNMASIGLGALMGVSVLLIVNGLRSRMRARAARPADVEEASLE